MTQQTPIIKNQAYTFVLGLPSVANSGKFQSAPTLGAGDVRVSKDGGSLSNITNLPSSNGKVVTVILTADEMNADNVAVVFSDQSGDEWQDIVVSIQTVAEGFSTHDEDDVVLAMQGAAADFKADISGLATSTQITALNDLSVSDVDAVVPSAADISTQVESALINEGDGQQLIDAIVNAIGNENITASTIATQVRSELATELARLDVAVGTRLADADYVPLSSDDPVEVVQEDIDEIVNRLALIIRKIATSGHGLSGGSS